MGRNTTGLILFIFITANICAQTTIAVVDFDARGISSNEVATLTDRFRDELIKTDKYSVIERGQMEEVLKEQGFQQSGCVSDECVAEVGQLIGVQQIIGGSIGKVGEVYSVSARIISVQSGEIINVVTHDHEGNIGSLLKTGIRDVVQNLVSSQFTLDSENQIGIGSVYIDSNPSGATIWINEKKFDGITPLLIDNLDEGMHNFYLENGNYSKDTTISIVGNDIVKMDIKLNQMLGQLRIVSTPFEAKILVDGVYRGITPLIIKELITGTHSLSIQKEGYSDENLEVDVVSNSLSEVSVDLRALASININTDPIGTIVLDYVELGISPISMTLDAGEHFLSVLHPYYYKHDEKFVIEPGEEKVIDIALRPKFGLLEIVTSPDKAKISIDNKVIGRSPTEVRLLEGEHSIVITKRGYETQTITRNALINERDTIDVVLNTHKNAGDVFKTIVLGSGSQHNRVSISRNYYDLYNGKYYSMEYGKVFFNRLIVWTGVGIVDFAFDKEKVYIHQGGWSLGDPVYIKSDGNAMIIEQTYHLQFLNSVKISPFFGITRYSIDYFDRYLERVWDDGGDYVEEHSKDKTEVIYSIPVGVSLFTSTAKLGFGVDIAKINALNKIENEHPLYPGTGTIVSFKPDGTTIKARIVYLF